MIFSLNARQIYIELQFKIKSETGYQLLFAFGDFGENHLTKGHFLYKFLLVNFEGLWIKTMLIIGIR